MDDLTTLSGPPLSLLVRILIALGIGFLIGLEREYAKRVVEKEEPFAGVRTYTIIALFGLLSAFLAERHGEWVYISVLLGLVGLVIATYALTAKAGSYGITTELSAILTFLLGGLVFEGYILLAVIVTVATTLLLSLKLPLHAFVTTLTAQEIRAFIQFVIISALVLPFLPDDGFGPGNIWNMHEIWTMVILVTGISLVGYLLAKILGSRKGTLISGIVGGLVSSTAVALSVARRSREHPGSAQIVASVSIIAATATLYPRILLEAWVVDRHLGVQMALPIALITIVAFGAAYFLHRRDGKDGAVGVPLLNPLNFTVAIQFVLAFMAVLWLMDLASAHYSAKGLYAASLLFGATDMDAITLSIARREVEPGSLQAGTAILLATLSNTVMKFLIVVFVGNRSLIRHVGIGFGAIFLATLLALLLMRVV